MEPLPTPEPASAPDGVEALFRAHGDELVGMLWVFARDRTVAEDLAQEAFVRLYQAWDRLEDSSRALAYLRATAFNLARSGFRRPTRAFPPATSSDPDRVP
jgi:DNA-directed RNA polymerase specialized sigma24 family protein